MELPKIFVVGAQSALFALFMIIDFYLLIPSICVRYVQRIKSKQDARRQPKTVVIVGGNFSGLAALRELQNNPLFNVVLIDQRQYFEYTPGLLRLFCEPNGIHKLARPLPHGNHYIIHGRVTSTYEKELVYVDAATEKSHSLKFDYLIMATGSTYNYPVSASPTETTLAARAAGWKAAAQRVKEASSILVLGGGAVGTELAAEIAEHYDGSDDQRRQKTIALVDAGHKLVPMFHPKVSDYAAEWFQKKRVKLMLGQKLESWGPKSCTFQNGRVIKADLVFVCFGDRPNSDPLVLTNGALTNGGAGIGKAVPAPVQLDRRKCVKVDEFLRVEGWRNVFCCGDVATPPTEGVKQAYHAELQGHVAGANVIRLATGRPFLRYPEGATSGSHLVPMVYVLSLGKWDGVIGFNSLTVPGPLAAVLKWIIEWTKIRQMMGRPIGVLVWMIGDAITFFISNNFLPPGQKEV